MRNLLSACLLRTAIALACKFTNAARACPFPGSSPALNLKRYKINFTGIFHVLISIATVGYDIQAWETATVKHYHHKLHSVKFTCKEIPPTICRSVWMNYILPRIVILTTLYDLWKNSLPVTFKGLIFQRIEQTQRYTFVLELTFLSAVF